MLGKHSLGLQNKSSFDLVISPASQEGIVTQPETGIKCKVKQDGYQALYTTE